MNNLRNNTPTPFKWKSNNVFIVVMIGATLSMKDFLAFPLMAGENGGGAFLLLYVFFLMIMGLPLLVSELFIGYSSNIKPLEVFTELAEDKQCSNYWQWIIRVSVMTSILVLAIYCVIAGWSLSFIFKTAIGLFEGANNESVNALLSSFQNDPERMMLWHTFFVIILLSISAQGMKRGVERLLMIIVPTMLFLLLVGLSYALFYGDTISSIEYLLIPDFSKIDINVAIMAMERAFYTLSVGLGIFILFGSKIPKGTPVVYSAFLIVTVDILFSILAGLAINALIFTSHATLDIGDEVAFSLLPLIFSQLPMGQLFGALFFLLLTLAAITSALALLEVFVNYLINKLNIRRIKAVSIACMTVWIFGALSIFSYTVWAQSGFTLELSFNDDAYRIVNEAGVHDVLIYLSSHLFQPMLAFFIMIFFGWVLTRERVEALLNFKSPLSFEVSYFMIRFVTPSLIFIVWLTAMGVIEYA